MEPSKIEYEIGTTTKGSALRLVKLKSPKGQTEWVLNKDEADIKDFTQRIEGLTPELILKMAEAVQQK